MLIGINNLVLYIYYLQKIKNKVIPYCLSLFFRTHPQALAQFDVLHINANNYHAIQAISCHTSVNYPPQKKFNNL